jgi:NAD(P)-dependent dehydrogenase (short-subunit alcohol dehydrogenase family)
MTHEQIVLITGTSSGFGRRMAETFARAGDSVFAGMRDPAGRNAKVRAELEALEHSGPKIEVVALDVTDDAQVDAAVARVIDRCGRIDVLINNAGYSLVGLSECSTVEQVRQLFETNYFGPVRMCRAVLPHMRAQRSGFVVHMSSIAGRSATPNSAHYGATKAALETLGEVQRYELASFGIDVSIIEPGLFATSIFDTATLADDVARSAGYGALADKPAQGMAIAQQMLAGGTPDPQEVADAVLRLARMPAGQRPLRLPMGREGAMLEPLNAISGPLGEAMFKAFGFI